MNGLVDETLKVIDAMYKDGRKVNFETVAREAEVSKGFLYYHPEIVERIDFYRILASANFKNKLNDILKENQVLRKKLNTYEKAMRKQIEKNNIT